MKNLRQLCITLVITLALIPAAFAGDMATGVTNPPPPPATSATSTQSGVQTEVAGDMATGSSEANAGNSVVEIALNLLESVLALV